MSNNNVSIEFKLDKDAALELLDIYNRYLEQEKENIKRLTTFFDNHNREVYILSNKIKENESKIKKFSKIIHTLESGLEND